MSEVSAELLPNSPSAVLSGPTFAAEVALDLPTAVTIASHDRRLARGFAAALGNSRFRPYLSNDPTGAEIGGAVKNVLAIACGTVESRGLGENARASLITRGLAETIWSGLAKGGRAETFGGLSGVGDLVLTCCATQSRNYALGVALVAVRSSVLRSPACAPSSKAWLPPPLSRDWRIKLGVEMPISEAVEAVLHRGASIDAMIDGLLRRPHRTE